MDRVNDRVVAQVNRYEIDEEHGFVRLIGVDTLTGDPFQQVVAAPDMALALKEYFVARHLLVKKPT